MTNHLAQAIQAARDDLHDIDVRLDDIAESMYDPAWTPESVAGRSSAPGSRVLFTQAYTASGDCLYPNREVYDVIQTELGEANDLLLKCPVPAGISPNDHRSSVPDVLSLRYAVRIVTGMLAWLADEELDQDETAKVLEACGHVSSARGSLDALYPKPVEVPRCKRAGCAAEDGRPRKLGKYDTKTCSACRKRDERERRRAS